jgi:hypothetical protein
MPVNSTATAEFFEAILVVRLADDFELKLTRPIESRDHARRWGWFFTFIAEELVEESHECFPAISPQSADPTPCWQKPSWLRVHH